MEGLTQPAPHTRLDAHAVLAWGVPRLRDLPWRRTRDPWAIVVSEVMLQQTQVARVIPRWTAFCEAYPDLTECARAPLADILGLWRGLGYPRRARNLHLAAITCVDRHDGVLPSSLDQLLALPGIGAYTARAVLAFAHGRDVAVVDTNIARVLARLAGERLTPRRAQSLADSLVPLGEGWAWNQVLMDVGATRCRPAAPRCVDCPLAEECAWRGGPEPDPAVGSAGVSTGQTPFAGSDRQGRGRLLDALHDGPAPFCEAAVIMRWPDDPDRVTRVVDTLIADGLVVRREDALDLPR